MLYMYPFMILFATFRNRDRVDFFYTPLNLKKWVLLNQNRSKYGHLQEIITPIVIYSKIYYTGSFSKYSCKILALLPIYFLHYNSSNFKKSVIFYENWKKTGL